MSEAALTCPFCGLLCDDLAVIDDVVETRGCALAAAGFARAAAPARPHAIAGRAVEFGEAAAAAARLLRAARAPHVDGLGTELHGMRALLALAERTGASIDHRLSPAVLANLAVARTSGWVTATFGEIANRADFFLLVGSDPGRRFPRFYERLVEVPSPLYRNAAPELVFLGPADAAPPRELVAARIEVPAAGFLDALGTVAALLDGAPAPAGALRELAGRLAAARYGVVVWDVAAFDPAEAELAVELLALMLRRLNATTRCVGLPLGGSDNALGAMQVALWQAGWPLPLGFASGAPMHDPWAHAGRRRLAAGEADLLLWVAALGAGAPPRCDATLVALVADDVVLERPAAVEIRVGVPGLHHGGAAVRGDTIVALPLQPARQTRRPSVAEAAAAILAALEAA